ncbi:hypothetical protein RJ639_015701 [Escallonia herrerae]|uniref:Sm domain-containing protein n=1 Tax=Escallonia herrerae TaxID=1293975 RepID=A0AA89ALW5_9ASTE|nr:hypothetical protein RJ639_015701 [Escallonia herrerae]
MEAENQRETSSMQSGVSDGSFPDVTSSVAQVKKLLLRRMLVGISDGRFFLGTFYCLDKQGNIILQDTVEYRSTRRSSPSPMEQRNLGLILIPSSCRISCHVDCSIEEQLSILSLQERKNLLQLLIAKQYASLFGHVFMLIVIDHLDASKYVGSSTYILSRAHESITQLDALHGDGLVWVYAGLDLVQIRLDFMGNCCKSSAAVAREDVKLSNFSGHDHGKKDRSHAGGAAQKKVITVLTDVADENIEEKYLVDLVDRELDRGEFSVTYLCIDRSLRELLAFLAVDKS